MRLGDLFKKIFGSSAAIPVDERTLSSTFSHQRFS
jgi:hypothetical protein